MSNVNNPLLNIYRALPHFRGKLRMGKAFFKNYVSVNREFSFRAHAGINYTIPNTIENIGLELLINGVYEKEVLVAIKKYMKNGAVFFDVGANIGSIGVPACLSFSGVRYHAFEPTRKTFDFLKKNVGANGMQQAKLVNKLVHAEHGQKFRFYESEFNGKNSLAPVYSQTYEELDSVSIDQYCRDEGIDQVDFMKVDVQGFELKVFEGAASMLEQKKIKTILFEFEYWADDAAGMERGSAQNYLLQKGYTLFTLEGVPVLQPLTEKEAMIFAFSS